MRMKDALEATGKRYGVQFEHLKICLRSLDSAADSSGCFMDVIIERRRNSISTL